MNTWPTKTEMLSFYGNPDPDGDGVPNRAWEDAHLARVISPWPMFLSWAPTTKLTSIRIHNKCAISLRRSLDNLWESISQDLDAIEHYGLNLFGGSFQYRPMRGSSVLSTHAVAAAIDLSPILNPLGKAYSRAPSARMMPQSAIDAFKAEGWVWGGQFSRGDAMHFQAVRV